jgi:Transposase DDE domain
MVDTGIGYFGDERLKKNGALFVRRLSERQEVCIRKLGDDRSEQVRLRRFLHNEAVTAEEMVAHRAMLAAAAGRGRHVLAIQDTSEINYQAQSGRKRRLGTVGNGSDIGLFVHPVLAVDAHSEECLGLVDVQVWRRTAGKAKNYRSLPIEQKESYRWLHGGTQAKAVLAEAAMVTVMDDREGDIYEKWARLPDAGTQLLTRACRDRNLANGGQLFATLADFAAAHRYVFDLAARPGKRSARQATMAVRFGCVRIRRPIHCSDARAPDMIELFAIEVRELEAPAGEEPVLWRLLTTHRVESVAQALTVIGWYRLRWHIEQLFRTLKRQGLGHRAKRDRGRRRARKTRRDRPHRRHHHHATRARSRRRRPWSARRRPRRLHRGARQPRLRPHPNQGSAHPAQETARSHVQTAKPLPPQQPRLGRLDHRPPRRMDRVPYRQVDRSHHHPRRAPTLLRYRRRIRDGQKCVLKLAARGERCTHPDTAG